MDSKEKRLEAIDQMTKLGVSPCLKPGEVVEIDPEALSVDARRIFERFESGKIIRIPRSLAERNQRIKDFQEEQNAILDAKGADYTGGRQSEDGNANFKEVARRLEGAPMCAMTVWAVYFEKQVIAIETYIKTGRVESEGMAGRFNDVANYSNIGRTLYEEER